MDKKQIELFRNKVKHIINQADPWYLLEMSAPEDEYDNYTDNVTSYIINNNPSLEQLNNKLIEIFSTTEFKLDNYKIRKLAEDLLKLDPEIPFAEKM